MATLALALAVMQDIERLREDVGKLVAFGTRSGLTDGAAKASEWLRKRLPGAAFHDFTDARFERPQRNVYAIVRGKKRSNEAVVIGAHYDARNRTDETGPAPGANDNASGTAAVLECARLLAGREHDRTLVFALFAAEEQGLIGARHFAKFLKTSGYDVIAMLNNDIVGGAKDEAGKPLNERDVRCFSEGPGDSPSRRLALLAKLVVERRVNEFTVLVQDRADRPGRGGDHQSFNREGLAAIRFIETKETDALHHTPGDTIERLHFPYLARVVEADAALLANLANAPAAPGAPRVRIVNGAYRAEWDAVEGAARYVVLVRRADPPFEKALEVDTTSATWDGPPEGSIDVFVAAVDARGNVSLFSPDAGFGAKK